MSKKVLVFPSSSEIGEEIASALNLNKELLEDRQKNDKCFSCFSCFVYIPYKLLVISIFLFPLFCFFILNPPTLTAKILLLR